MQQKQELAKKSYPKLWEKFPYSNFHVIIEAVQEQFHTLFDLPVLNEAAGDAELSQEAYFRWFSSLMSKLKGKARKDEVIAELAFELNNDDCIRDFYTKELIFVADKNGLKGNQLGYPERVVSGKATPAEAVSFLDAFRYKEMYEKEETSEESRKREKSTPVEKQKVGVFNLTHLMAVDRVKRGSPYSRDLLQFDQLLININHNLSDIPKWVAVDFKKLPGNMAAVYSEAALLPKEQIELEQILGLYGKTVEYDKQGGQASEGVSDGYLALTWLNHETIANDFWGLRKKFMGFLGGSEKNNLIKKEVKIAYFSPVMRNFYEYWEPTDGHDTVGGHIQHRSFNEFLFGKAFRFSVYCQYDIGLVMEKFPIGRKFKNENEQSGYLIFALSYNHNHAYFPDLFNDEASYCWNDQIEIKKKIIKNNTEIVINSKSIKNDYNDKNGLRINGSHVRYFAYIFFQVFYVCHHLKKIRFEVNAADR